MSIGFSTEYSIFLSSLVAILIAILTSLYKKNRIFSNWINLIPLFSLVISSAIYIKFDNIYYSSISMMILIVIYLVLRKVRNVAICESPQ